jgi:uncharacterized protein (DUF58 family)
VTAHEGDKVEMIEVIRNRKPLPLPWVRVESRIPPSLRFTGALGEERAIEADQYHRSIFFLGPYQQVTRRHEITCSRRGFYSVGSAEITSGDLFAFSHRSKHISLDCSLTVYPGQLSEDEVDYPSSRWQGDLAVKRWIMPDLFLTDGLREYRAGDPLRDIHWRATARSGQLQVKVRGYTVDPRALVVLNIQKSEDQWGELMEYEREGIEHGMRIAAALCMTALTSGSEAGFASNACLAGDKGNGRTVYIPSRRSFDQAEQILTVMARMLIHREVTFNTLLDGLYERIRDTDIIILTMYVSSALTYCVEKLRAKGNSITLVNMRV